MGILVDYETKIPILESWLRTQYHLPQCIDKILLRRFIYTCQGDVEKAKKLIDLNYTMRNTYSHIFLKRDPADAETQNILKVTDMLILPGVTRNDYKVLFYRLADVDPDHFNFTEAIKTFFMFADTRFITPESVEAPSSGEVPIFDMEGFSLRHITRIVLSSLRIYMKVIQEAHPVRLKEIHVINCPSYLDKVLTVIKPFIKSEVFKLIKFHLPGSDTLYKDIPKEMLPTEYGGNAGSIKEIKEHWVNIIMQRRDYLKNEKYWKINESKRGNGKEIDIGDGNFRSLTID